MSMINLNDVFYDLWEDGYIYDEDENGLNMSYGECVAISDYFWECVEDELDNYYDFESKLDAWNEILSTAADDVYMFWTWDQDNDFYFDIDEENGTYDVSGKLPPFFKESWEEWKEYTDLEPSRYARDPEFDW